MAQRHDMVVNEAALARVLVIAQELDAAGRPDDAKLLTQLASAVMSDVVPDVPSEELNRRLAQAEADIAAGRLTPDAEVWAQVESARSKAVLHS